MGKIAQKTGEYSVYTLAALTAISVVAASVALAYVIIVTVYTP